MGYTKVDNPEYVHGGETLIEGTESADTLTGFTTDDTIVGGAGNDVINGDSSDHYELESADSLAYSGTYTNGRWGLFDEFNGWKHEGSALIEVQKSGLIGTTPSGQVIFELDSTENSEIYRDITDLNPSHTHTVSFDFSARPRVAEDSNTIEIYWDGVLLDTITADGRGLKNFEWTNYSYDVPVSDSDARLTFKGVGDSDSLGGMVSNITVVASNPAFDLQIDGGNDLLIGGLGDDTINAGAGDDVLIGGAGADIMDGGAGDRDIASFKESDGRVYVNLDKGVGLWNDAAGDTYANIEFVHGSGFDDQIIGDGSVNRLVGNDGDDTISGGGGNDILIGANGADILDGGSGNRDVADYSWSNEGVDVNLATGVGSGGDAEGDTLSKIEFLYGSFFDDVLTGNDAANRLVGDFGDDMFFGAGGNDILIGGEGADALDGGEGNRDAAEYGGANAGVGVNLVTGGFAGEALGDTFAGIEFVYGSDFADNIMGDDGINRLVGEAGDDVLNGAGGNDYLLGMSGNDTLIGGAGDDVFLYTAAFGNDTITGFEAGLGRTDRIWLDDLGFSSFEDLALSDGEFGAVVDLGSLGTITLEKIDFNDLVADDFIF
jgi:Ca2+-binding RTX toxin-like protein